MNPVIFKIYSSYVARIYSQLCLGITKRNTDWSKLGQDPTRNIFYVRYKELDKESSCGVESTLSKWPDKNVFLFEVGENEDGALRYEKALLDKYPNLQRIKRAARELLEDSPFEALTRELNPLPLTTMTGINALWQFGGAFLSESLLVTNRDSLSSVPGSCYVHPQVNQLNLIQFFFSNCLPSIRF